MGLEKTLSQLMDCPLSTNNTHIIMSTKRTHSIFEVVHHPGSHLYDKFEDTKRVFRICKPKDRQYNG